MTGEWGGAAFSYAALQVNAQAFELQTIVRYYTGRSGKLREWHYGLFRGHTYAKARLRYRADYRRFIARDPGFDFGSGEYLTSFAELTVWCGRMAEA